MSDYLLGELLLAQLVEGEEFARQLHVVYKPTTGQFHPNDDLTVWNHHGHRAEADLQVLRKLLAPCITWVLTPEDKRGFKDKINLYSSTSGRIDKSRKI